MASRIHHRTQAMIALARSESRDSALLSSPSPSAYKSIRTAEELTEDYLVECGECGVLSPWWASDSGACPSCDAHLFPPEQLAAATVVLRTTGSVARWASVLNDDDGEPR